MPNITKVDPHAEERAKFLAIQERFYNEIVRERYGNSEIGNSLILEPWMTLLERQSRIDAFYRIFENLVIDNARDSSGLTKVAKETEYYSAVFSFRFKEKFVPKANLTQLEIDMKKRITLTPVKVLVKNIDGKFIDPENDYKDLRKVFDSPLLFTFGKDVLFYEMDNGFQIKMSGSADRQSQFAEVITRFLELIPKELKTRPLSKIYVGNRPVDELPRHHNLTGKLYRCALFLNQISGRKVKEVPLRSFYVSGEGRFKK